MSRQVEIRNGIEKIVAFCDSEPDICAGEIIMYLEKMGVVIKVGEIRELERAAADSEAYVADGVGVSWERSAPIFGEFKRAGYAAVEPLILTTKSRSIK